MCVGVFIWGLFVLNVVVSQRRCLFDVLCVYEQTQSQRVSVWVCSVVRWL